MAFRYVMSPGKAVCDWQKSEYASLEYSFFSPHPIFLTMSFYDNEQVLPTFFSRATGTTSTPRSTTKFMYQYTKMRAVIGPRVATETKVSSSNGYVFSYSNDAIL